MSKQAKPFLPTHLHCVNKQNFQQRMVQLVKHIQDAASHQYPDNIWMKEDWRDLGEVQKLHEEREKRETEPRIKLFLAEIRSVVGLFFKGQRLVVYCENGNAVWNKKASSKLLFGQETDQALQSKEVGSCALSATFLGLTTCTSGSNISLCRHVEKLQATQKPARDNADCQNQSPSPSNIRWCLIYTTRNLSGSKVQA